METKVRQLFTQGLHFCHAALLEPLIELIAAPSKGHLVLHAVAGLGTHEALRMVSHATGRALHSVCGPGLASLAHGLLLMPVLEETTQAVLVSASGSTRACYWLCMFDMGHSLLAMHWRPAAARPVDAPLLIIALQVSGVCMRMLTSRLYRREHAAAGHIRPAVLFRGIGLQVLYSLVPTALVMTHSALGLTVANDSDRVLAGQLYVLASGAVLARVTMAFASATAAMEESKHARHAAATAATSRRGPLYRQETLSGTS